MNRQKLPWLALAGVVVLVAGAAAEQAPEPAAGAQPAARPRLVAPVRGEALLGYTKPVVRNSRIDGKDYVVTTIQVKNMSSGAIAGLKVDEFWYDKAGNPITGDTYRHRSPLMQGEILTITLETPRVAGMNSNQYNFTHANGEIKTEIQPKLE
jgi:hypothetical protein